MTTEELEGAAYAQGNTILADAYGRVLELEDALGDALAMLDDAGAQPDNIEALRAVRNG